MTAGGLHVDARLRRGSFTLEVAAEIPAGHTLGIIGPNGAGKTSLLRAIAGLTALDAGLIAFGTTPWDQPDAGVFVDPTRRRCPILFQDYRLFPHLSVLDNVAYPHRVTGTRRRQARDRARATLELFGLTDLHELPPRQLSGGQAQRVAMARALTTDPHVLLLDEPLAALDARTRQATRVELKAMLGRFTGPAVLVTHDPLEAMTLADHLLVLEAGRVVQHGTPHDLAARPATDYVARLVGVNLYTGTMTADGIITLPEGGSLHVAIDNDTAARVGEPALVALSPTAISVHRNRPESLSAQNVWPAVIRGVEPLRDRIRLELHGQPSALVDITPRALTDLALDIGDAVWLSAKATEAHAYTAQPAGPPTV